MIEATIDCEQSSGSPTGKRRFPQKEEVTGSNPVRSIKRASGETGRRNNEIKEFRQLS